MNPTFRHVLPFSTVFRHVCHVLLCSAVFRRFPPFSAVFRRVPPCSAIFHQVLPCSAVFAMFHNVPKCPTMFRHALSYSAMLSNGFAMFRCVPLVSLSSAVFRHGLPCSAMFHHVPPYRWKMMKYYEI